jgi:hypothetical protein
LEYITYGHLVYFMAIWYSLWPFGNVVVIWYIFPRFGILCHGKSGNPEWMALNKWYLIPAKFLQWCS